MASAGHAPAAEAPPRRPKSARRWSREFAVQALYERFVADHDALSIRRNREADADFKRVDREFFDELWTAVSTQGEALADLVRPHLDRSFEQISPIERSIVLIGAWELQSRLDIPYRVVINEAVELAKTFGGTDGHKWVNGVLDKLAPLLRADELADAGRRKPR
ncbi:MAG: transcription antitermination factor NusB [Proteobacteria bacterium]|nr:transcription antitermination factor NusB [Pseudomonadota bacterium]